jgi:hypothetical protein
MDASPEVRESLNFWYGKFGVTYDEDHSITVKGPAW